MPLSVTESRGSVHETVERALSALASRGIEVFARIDHGAGARAAGLELPDEEVLVFGDPRVGTLLMQSDPEIGLELPLRLLVWRASGRTLVGYVPPTELAARYGVQDRVEVLERMSGLMEQLVGEIAAG
jgi:uncharacterized protein (DUF302 family)